MPVDTRQEKTTPRQHMIRYLIRYLENRGYQVTHADLPGYSQPPVIVRYQPAVLACNHKNLYAIGDIISADVLDHPGVIAQIDTYTGFQDAYLYLCIPATCRDRLPPAILTNPFLRYVYYPPFDVKSILHELTASRA